MNISFKIGYFAHWFRPPYKFVDFLREEGIEVEKIDFSIPMYLEKYDVVIIEQNGFNDYIENDELYIHVDTIGATPLSNFSLEKFIRVEIEGENKYRICNTTPFYLI